MKMFVAIDGEADNNGNYIVMCDSTGRTLYRPQGICSFDALNFILTVPGKPDVVNTYRSQCISPSPVWF